MVTAVASFGIADRDWGMVGFTTSLGFPRKLERITGDPRVALAYHAREHGFSALPWFMLAQGRAGLLAHAYRAQLVGLSTRTFTGWLEASPDGAAIYAPHTSRAEAGSSPSRDTPLAPVGRNPAAGLATCRAARAPEAVRLWELSEAAQPSTEWLLSRFGVRRRE